MFRHALSCLALASLFVLPACDLGLGGLTPDTSDYDFSTTCRSQSDIDACDTCCEGLGAQQALVATGSCGCGYLVRDNLVCSSTSNFDACEECCNGAGFDGITSYSGGTGGSECTCSRVQPTPPAGGDGDAGM